MKGSEGRQAHQQMCADIDKGVCTIRTGKEMMTV